MQALGGRESEAKGLKCRYWEEERMKQKDALMPGSDVEGKRDGGWRVNNGEKDRAGPHR